MSGAVAVLILALTPAQTGALPSIDPAPPAAEPAPPASPDSVLSTSAGTRVTQLIREALHRPEREETWACLALALGRLQSPASGRETELGAAVSVADSLACSAVGLATPFMPDEPALARGPSSAPGTEGVVGRIAGVVDAGGRWMDETIRRGKELASRKPWLAPALLALCCLALLVLALRMFSIGRRSGAGTGEPGSRRGSVPSTTRGEEDPKRLALALREGGMTLLEIARRTGMAQDALSVLFAVGSPEGRR